MITVRSKHMYHAGSFCMEIRLARTLSADVFPSIHPNNFIRMVSPWSSLSFAF